MNENGNNRINKWLPIVATTALLRVLLIPVQAITSALSVGLGRIPFEFVQHIRWAIPIFTPVIAVALAVLVARAAEEKMMALDPAIKRVVLLVLAVLALLPWQLQIRTTARAVMWEEGPEHMREEMRIQQTPEGDSSTRADADLGTLLE